MNSEPLLFSIVIPTYNRAHLIAATLHTVLKQDYRDFEVLVIDDGSTDNTAEVVGQFADPRLSYHRKTNAERGAARNFGAAMARGRYVNFFDSDDLLYPHHLSEAARLIAEHKSPEWFHLAYDYRTPDNQLLFTVTGFTQRTVSALLFDNRLSCNGVFLRKDIAAQYPFVEDRVLASSEDWHLWIRLICRFHLYFSNCVTSTVVQHDQRSLRTIPADKIEARDLLLINLLYADAVVQQRYGSSFRKFVAQRYTFFMLHRAAQKNRQKVFSWARQAAMAYPLILFTKRFLAAIKNSLT